MFQHTIPHVCGWTLSFLPMCGSVSSNPFGLKTPTKTLDDIYDPSNQYFQEKMSRELEIEVTNLSQARSAAPEERPKIYNDETPKF